MKNISFIKIIFLFIIIGFSILAVTGHFPNKLGNVVGGVMDKLYKYEYEEPDPFWTSIEHRKRLGIEIVKLSSSEEQELHSMIEEVIKEGFSYYDTGKEKEFEVVRDLFLPEEYERVKLEIDRTREKREMWEGEDCKVPIEISEKKFSQPRKYKELNNRIGIIIIIPFISPDFLGSGCIAKPKYIFIFKKMNNEWKIEKMWSVSIRLEWSEENIIQILFQE
ncbi:hypothetical protein C4E24_00975 [ANME-1 cluster archaeon AG-394-G21]|nr:hypothetical protein [ANME-1 cluster archaeon AG-394-G21]